MGGEVRYVKINFKTRGIRIVGRENRESNRKLREVK